MAKLSDQKKEQIASLPVEEMAYEINLGRRSRFQREKFAYLQTCYQKRIEEEKSKNILEAENHPNNAKDVINEKQQQKESKLVWFARSVAVIIFATITVWVLNHYFNLGLL